MYYGISWTTLRNVNGRVISDEEQLSKILSMLMSRNSTAWVNKDAGGD